MSVNAYIPAGGDAHNSAVALRLFEALGGDT
jgi:hypothetical protein